MKKEKKTKETVVDGEALRKTIPFFFSTLVAIIIFAFGDSPYMGYITKVVLLIVIGLLLSWTTYFIVQKGHIITPDRLIDELLETVSNVLGRDNYRLNVMVPSNHDEIQDIVFEFRNSSKNYPSTRNYSGKFKVTTNGVGTSYLAEDREPKVHCIEKGEIDSSKDPFPKTIFSLAIRRGTRNIAVLNLDTSEENMSNEKKDNISEVLINLSNTINLYI